MYHFCLTSAMRQNKTHEAFWLWVNEYKPGVGSCILHRPIEKKGRANCCILLRGTAGCRRSAMLLHCTKRLAAKLPQDHVSNPPSAVSSDERTPLGEWHGHLLLLDRRQCVIFCLDLTRYVLFLPGLRAAQLADLGRWHLELFLATFAVQGLPSSHLVRLELMFGPLRIDCRTDRSVLGSLRVAADDLRYGSLPRVSNVLDLDPLVISHELNQRPRRAGKTLIWPAEAMRKLVEEAVQHV
jgi:hypothetical protein